MSPDQVEAVTRWPLMLTLHQKLLDPLLLREQLLLHQPLTHGRLSKPAQLRFDDASPNRQRIPVLLDGSGLGRRHPQDTAELRVRHREIRRLI